MRANWLLAVALLVTAAVYWPGLHGPFLLDDFHNLRPLQQWLDGEVSWQSIVFGNDSGMFGRAVPMASFLLTTAISGATNSFPFKLGNLLIHLLCGYLGYLVLRKALALDPKLASRANTVAAILAALWLLHPLHVSTVLYAVQRMAQLSTLFVLAAIWIYLEARQQLHEDHPRRAALALFVIFPVLLGIGLLSKENAAVAPALCLVLEAAFFTKHIKNRRLVAAFFALFLILPALTVSGILVLDPDRLIGGYNSREFSLIERVLSQPRALMEYVGQLLMPRGPQMGLYSDDFAVSTSLLSPPSTLISLIGLITISVFAIAMRNRTSSMFAGWFFFLVAHSIESSFIPLELYFEHRNYLPTWGILLALAGLTSLFPGKLGKKITLPVWMPTLAVSAFVVVLTFATLGRVLVWQDKGSIIEQGLRHHPTSRRANIDYATRFLGTDRHAESMRALEQLTQSKDRQLAAIAQVDLITSRCLQNDDADPVALAHAADSTKPVMSLAESYAWSTLANAVLSSDCGRVRMRMVADTIVEIVEAAYAQPDSIAKWRLRHNAADIYIRTGQWSEAREQAELAWAAGGQIPTGGMLVLIYAHEGDNAAAERMLAQMTTRIRPYDLEGQAQLASLRQIMNQNARVSSKTSRNDL